MGNPPTPPWQVRDATPLPLPFLCAFQPKVDHSFDRSRCSVAFGSPHRSSVSPLRHLSAYREPTDYTAPENRTPDRVGRRPVNFQTPHTTPQYLAYLKEVEMTTLNGGICILPHYRIPCQLLLSQKRSIIFSRLYILLLPPIISKAEGSIIFLRL